MRGLNTSKAALLLSLSLSQRSASILLSSNILSTQHKPFSSKACPLFHHSLSLSYFFLSFLVYYPLIKTQMGENKCGRNSPINLLPLKNLIKLLMLIFNMPITSIIYSSLRLLEGESIKLEDSPRRSRISDVLSRKRAKDKRRRPDSDFERDDECGICMEGSAKMVWALNVHQLLP